MIFDYHGYGTSEGEPSPAATIADGHAALREMRKLYPDKKIVVFAQSLGGAIGLRAVIDMKNEVPVSLVVADSTFASYRSVARSTLAHGWITWPFQPLGWLVMSDEFAPRDVLSNLAPTPLVVIHGEKDRTVSIDMGWDVYDHAAQPKEFWSIPGGTHTDSMYRPAIAKRFIEKLDSICR